MTGLALTSKRRGSGSPAVLVLGVPVLSRVSNSGLELAAPASRTAMLQGWLGNCLHFTRPQPAPKLLHVCGRRFITVFVTVFATVIALTKDLADIKVGNPVPSSSPLSRARRYLLYNPSHAEQWRHSIHVSSGVSPAALLPLPAAHGFFLCIFCLGCDLHLRMFVLDSQGDLQYNIQTFATRLGADRLASLGACDLCTLQHCGLRRSPAPADAGGI